MTAWPAYPKGIVVGACVCGSWPGGECLKCPRLMDGKPMIFVFGSNLAGRHGKGAAQWARLHRGAIYGRGEGFQGQSYAIPTKDTLLNPLPLGSIAYYVKRFLRFADDRPDLTFELTAIGTGLAGYSISDIAPMFAVRTPNIVLPEEFASYLA